MIEYHLKNSQHISWLSRLYTYFIVLKNVYCGMDIDTFIHIILCYISKILD